MVGDVHGISFEILWLPLPTWTRSSATSSSTLPPRPAKGAHHSCGSRPDLSPSQGSSRPHPTGTPPIIRLVHGQHHHPHVQELFDLTANSYTDDLGRLIDSIMMPFDSLKLPSLVRQYETGLGPDAQGPSELLEVQGTSVDARDSDDVFYQYDPFG